MKRNFLASLLFVFVSVVFTSCGSQNNSTDKTSDVISNPGSGNVSTDKNAFPVITFEKDFHDFGKINSGEKITYAFKFKNTGKSVLLITNVSTSCGCTVTSFPKQPIQPGEESSIDVSFDSTGKHGLQTKSVIVFTNAQPTTTTLRIQSLINDPENI
jgi:hypothetical protein